MIFNNPQALTGYVKEYFKENIKQYLIYRKELIYFPKNCSEQMANLVCDHINEKTKYTAVLKGPHKNVYKLYITYPTVQKSKTKKK